LYQEQNEAPQIMGGPPVAFLLRKQTAKCNPDAEGVVAGRQGRESDLLQGEVQGSLAALLKTTGYGFGFRVHGPEVSGVESSFFEFRTKEKQFLTTTVEIPSLVRISYTSSPSLRANAQVRHSRYEYKLRWGVKFAPAPCLRETSIQLQEAYFIASAGSRWLELGSLFDDRATSAFLQQSPQAIGSSALKRGLVAPFCPSKKQISQI
jgi:hypothetical protein